MRIRYKRIVLLVVATFGASAQAEVFKCTEDGKTVFQDRPCRSTGASVKVQPATGGSSAPALSSAPDSLAKTKADVAGMALDRRRREIGYQIEKLESDIRGYERSRDIEMSALRQRKAYAKNNLAGATWEQSISTEMQAVTEKYRTNIEGARIEISQLRQELTEIAKVQTAASK